MAFQEPIVPTGQHGRSMEETRRLLREERIASRAFRDQIRPFVFARLRPYADKFASETRDLSREYLMDLGGRLRESPGMMLLVCVFEPGFAVMAGAAAYDLARAKLNASDRRSEVLASYVDHYAAALTKCWRRHVLDESRDHPFASSPGVTDRVDPFWELGEKDGLERRLVLEALLDFIVATPTVTVPGRIIRTLRTELP